MIYVGGHRVRHYETLNELTGDRTIIVRDADYQCQECKRFSTVSEFRLTIAKYGMALSGKFEEIRNKANMFGPRCDCNLARCRVGAALQRKNRLLYRRKSNG